MSYLYIVSTFNDLHGLTSYTNIIRYINYITLTNKIQVVELLTKLMYFNFKIGFALHQRSSVTPLVRIRRPGLTYKQTNLFFLYPTKNILQTNIKQLSDICPTVFCNILRISLLWLLAQSSPSLVDLSDLSLFFKGKKTLKMLSFPYGDLSQCAALGGGGGYILWRAYFFSDPKSQICVLIHN